MSMSNKCSVVSNVFKKAEKKESPAKREREKERKQQNL